MQKLFYSHIAFQVRDMDAAMRFYCDGLGMRVKFTLTTDDTVAFARERGELRADGTSDNPYVAHALAHPGRPPIRYLEMADGQFLELFYTDGALRAPGELAGQYGYQHLALQVADLQAARQALQERGIVPDTEIAQGPDYTRQFWIHDPDGNRIELMEYTARSFQVAGNPRERGGDSKL